jgi:hypothetical protein
VLLPPREHSAPTITSHQGSDVLPIHAPSPGVWAIRVLEVNAVLVEEVLALLLIVYQPTSVSTQVRHQDMRQTTYTRCREPNGDPFCS